MGRKYDIAQKIASANKKATVVIDDEHEFVINTGKSVVIMAMALADEIGTKTQSESMEAMDKIFDLVFKKEEIEYLQSLDLTFSAYQLIFTTIFAAFNDDDIEVLEERMKNPDKKN